MLETVKTTKVIDGVEIIDRNILSRFEKGELLNTTATIAVSGPVLNPYVFESAFKIAAVVLFSNTVLENLNEIETEEKIDKVFEIIKLQLNDVDFDLLQKQALELCEKTGNYYLSAGASIDGVIDKISEIFSSLGFNLEEMLTKFSEAAEHLQENDYTSVIQLAEKYGIDRHQTK